jgi:hypothetical protein
MVGLSDQMNQIDKDRFEAYFGTKQDLLSAIERVQLEGGKILDVVAKEGSLENYFVKTVEAAA